MIEVVLVLLFLFVAISSIALLIFLFVKIVENNIPSNIILSLQEMRIFTLHKKEKLIYKLHYIAEDRCYLKIKSLFFPGVWSKFKIEEGGSWLWPKTKQYYTSYHKSIQDSVKDDLSKTIDLYDLFVKSKMITKQKRIESPEMNFSKNKIIEEIIE